MPHIDYGYGYQYFNKHSCTIPDRTTLEVSADCKTVTIKADPGTCFGPTQPTITIWSSLRGDIVGTYNMTMSADRTTLTYTYVSESYFIYKCQINNAWTYKMELAEGYSGTGRFVMRYDVDHESYEPQFIADYGYKMHPSYTFYAYLYSEYDDTTPAVSVNIDPWPDGKRVGWPYEIDGAWPSAWEGYKRIVIELATVTNNNEPILATITNGTQHNSYAIRSVWDSVNEVWKAVLEVASDLYWFPRSTFQIAVNSVAKTLTYDNDFYYKQKSVTSLDVTNDIAVSGRTIVMSGDMYHRDWPFIDFGQSRNILGYENWSNVDRLEWEALEDVVKVKCISGYRFKQWYNSQHPEGTPLEAAWVFFTRDNVPYYLTVEPNRTYGTIDLSAWNTGNAHTCHSNNGGPEAIPVSNVNVLYDLTQCSVQGTAPSVVSMSGHLQLTLQANSGYRFDTAPYLTYKNSWGYNTNVAFTVSQDKLTASIDWYPASVDLSDDYPNNASFVIHGTAAVAPVTFDATVVNAISGTTYDVVGTTINVYAPNGYHFTAAPTLHWHESEWDDEGDANFTMAADGKSAYINANSWRTSIYTLTINGAIEQDHQWAPGTITVPQHTTYSVNGTTLTVTCDTGYQFASAPTIAQAGSAGPITMTLNGASNVATANIEDYDGLAVTVTGTVEATPTPVETYQVYTQLTNCTGTGIPASAAANDTLNITLTCDAGYIFDPNDIPSLDYIKNDNLTYHVYFTIGTDTATLSVNLSTLEIKSGSALTVYGEGVYNDTPTPPDPPTPGPSIEDKYGMVNIYHVSSSELATFASRRFQYDQNMNVFDDWGNYVTSLRRVFVTIASETVSAIKCGRYNTNISSHTPTTDTVTLNFGNVTLPAPNHDITDYSSKVQIFLPFIGFRDISAEYAGKTLSLTYEINIVTGEGVAKLTCNSNVVYLYECAPSSDMAYKTNTMVSQTLGGSNFNTKYMYGLVPYVLVKWYSNKNKHLVNSDCLRCTIGDFQGYAKFNEVTDINNNQITAEEKNLLLRTLAGGVYIEDEQD